jgi:hypothetical protein
MSFLFCAAWVGHTDQSREMAQDIVRAFELAGLKHETAAGLMGVTPPMLARQLAGIEPLNAYRLCFLPVEFHGALLRLRAERIGGALITAEQLAIIKGALLLGPKRILMALVMLPAISAWPVFVFGTMAFAVALVVIARDRRPGLRRVAFGVLMAAGVGLGPFVAPMHAASVRGGICALFPFLLECWLF